AWCGLAEARLEDFNLDPHGIAWTHRRRPAQFVDCPADDATSDLHRFNEESHRHRRRLPAARRQAPEQMFAHTRIEMKRLRIVATRELDDLLGRDGLAG